MHGAKAALWDAKRKKWADLDLSVKVSGHAETSTEKKELAPQQCQPASEQEGSFNLTAKHMHTLTRQAGVLQWKQSPDKVTESWVWLK